MPKSTENEIFENLFRRLKLENSRQLRLVKSGQIDKAKAREKAFQKEVTRSQFRRLNYRADFENFEKVCKELDYLAEKTSEFEAVIQRASRSISPDILLDKEKKASKILVLEKKLNNLVSEDSWDRFKLHNFLLGSDIEYMAESFGAADWPLIVDEEDSVLICDPYIQYTLFGKNEAQNMAVRIQDISIEADKLVVDWYIVY